MASVEPEGAHAVGVYVGDGMRNTERNRKVSGRVSSPGYRSDVLEILSRVLSQRPDVVPGMMFGFPAFYTAGKLFACVYGEGVGLKLPQDRVRQLEGKPGITPFQPYGKSRMREWIHIRRDPASTLAKDASLLEASITFVGRAAASSRGPRGTKRPASPASK